MLEPLVDRDRKALSDLIAQRLLSAISDGTLAPGEQLTTETELARQLGVGRTSLREAIQRLRAIGVLDVRKGVGTFVVDVTRLGPVRAFLDWCLENEFEVSELFEARMTIEVAVVSLAADRATEDDLRALREAARRHGSATEIEELIATDEEFHAALVAAAHNALIAQLYSMLVPGLREFRRMSLAIPASARQSFVTHDAIIDAIATGNPAASRVAAAEHLWPLYSSVTQAARAGRAGQSSDDRRIWFLD